MPAIQALQGSGRAPADLPFNPATSIAPYAARGSAAAAVSVRHDVAAKKFLLYRYVSAQTSRNFLPYGKNWSRSPRSQAARISGVVMSQSGRIRRVTSRRSDHKSDIDGRPQYQ